MIPFVESNDILTDDIELKSRAHRDGYLFFRGLADKENLLELRHRFTEILDRHDWLIDDVDTMEARSLKEFSHEGGEDWWPIFDEFQRLRLFHQFAHDPGVVGVFDRLFGEPTLPHPRNIGRIIFPNADTTPPHQDYVHVQGTPDTWTSWIPLGNVPCELGGLAVYAGSHVHGILPVRDMKGAGGVGIANLPPGHEWHTSEFVAGDVLLFHSHLVHRGLDNETPDRIRISVDYRYQPVSHKIAQNSLEPHLMRFGWDFVYENWDYDEFKYYWKDLPLEVVPHRADVYIRENDTEVPQTETA
jgi:hypothetical protein